MLQKHATNILQVLKEISFSSNALIVKLTTKPILKPVLILMAIPNTTNFRSLTLNLGATFLERSWTKNHSSCNLRHMTNRPDNKFSTKISLLLYSGRWRNEIGNIMRSKSGRNHRTLVFSPAKPPESLRPSEKTRDLHRLTVCMIVLAHTPCQRLPMHRNGCHSRVPSTNSAMPLQPLSRHPPTRSTSSQEDTRLTSVQCELSVAQHRDILRSSMF
jgi:hypothetical protein